MRVLVTGCDGQLGKAVAEELLFRGHVVIKTNRKNMDITQETIVREIFCENRPEAVIHCAAYTNVDKAEGEKEICRKVNVKGTEYIAKCCEEQDVKMMYVSTEYVFAGEGNEPYRESDKGNPLNVYGKSKYDGEQSVRRLDKYFIVRTSWVFGDGRNFVASILNKAKSAEKLKVVNDQTGSPTYAEDLAKLLVRMIESEKYGVYHASNEGECTWYEFAKEILIQSDIDTDIEAVTSSEFPVKAKRPLNSRLSKSKLDEAGFERLPHWKDALQRYLKEEL